MKPNPKRLAKLEVKFSKSTPKDERRYKRAEKKIAKGGAKAEAKYGYDYKTASAQGITPDATGHWPSLGDNGRVLKGPKHPTIYKTKKIERAMGNKITKKDGVRYSTPRKK